MTVILLWMGNIDCGKAHVTPLALTVKRLEENCAHITPLALTVKRLEENCTTHMPLYGRNVVRTMSVHELMLQLD